LLFGTLAIGWFLLSFQADPRRRALRRAALAGVFAGLACGAKLTAIPMLVIALPLAMIAMACARGRVRGWLLQSATFVLAAIVTLFFCFWLVFTHLQSRFLVLTSPVMAMRIALTPRTRFGALMCGVTVAVVGLSTCIGVTSKLIELDDTMRMRTGSLGLFDVL